MSYYYSLRGWLEVSPEDFTKIVEKLKSLQVSYLEDQKLGLYMKGWCWYETPINWSGYLFYGAEVSIEGLDLLENVLKNITSMNLQVSGYFHAQGEDGEKNFVYKVVDDGLTVEPSHILIDVN
ncbi:MAG TPA: hypothetical protein VK203_31405 [Nostocaceae cyanobacterium]|nr:hypothetical protein [Nostocaceae cyanobacterium]